MKSDLKVRRHGPRCVNLCARAVFASTAVAAAAETAVPIRGNFDGNVLPARDSALVLQLEQLRDKTRALQVRLGVEPLAPTRPAEGWGQSPPPHELPAWNCADCPRDLGVERSNIDVAGTSSEHTLPGFPGEPHLYHLGAEDFFLSRSQRIGLSVEQQVTLAGIRERALLARADAGREIEAADQRLFMLTAAARPDAESIEAQVRRIEALRTAGRLHFIRAVGEAAQVLSAEQRHVVLGSAP
ncbi:periplasmic heavy metal sensor [Tahibacter amnicola]|uniref:Signaling pathway modulator ZraP n=1 Tax=Tahibacter amnicola TaxID=2976241 RepID=A0ABY6B7J2_9GAMM|nr:periplasmic heavy metal sensor [Tahibacter amnicola]UXI66068.1 periplasmic heavy metal sensor [Tahibacter amnicola]